MTKFKSFLTGAKAILPGVILLVIGLGFIVGALALSHWVGRIVEDKTNAGWGTLADFGTYFALAFVYFFLFDLVKVRVESGKWDHKPALKGAIKDYIRFMKFVGKVVAVVAIVIGIIYLGFKIFIAGGIVVLLLTILIAIAVAILVFVILIFAMVW
ncbi:putative membrane bound protein [Bacillus phage vB_BmeM-Goe8]|uniref:Putative membrane bound protein n=1 Tax=Bacillus phage vB_BmeM-Goe8 TaxID=2593638 RepID=A0A516KMW3_9CAUD|nr:putative membrane bound protein [Bacillus phage vB_BmeM-Goe8]QDP42923.1 putative membrane bound protein [Bacillus phage vB_BmeM-Goe8]